MILPNNNISKGFTATLIALGMSGALTLIPKPVSAQHITTAGAQLTGLNGFNYEPIFTVGETINGYQPPGILDGIGAVEGSSIGLGDNIVRVLVNHEIAHTPGSDGTPQGSSYTLENGTVIEGGARISYFDIDKNSRQIVDSGLAFDTIFNRALEVVDDPLTDFDLGRTALSRFCSSAAFVADAYGAGLGFEDTIYITGEETTDGSIYALDIANGDLYAVPSLGRGGWENVTQINTGLTDTVALLLADDTSDSPMYLYVGTKDAGGNFLERNGLADGTIYAWVPDSGNNTPETFNGTGSSETGTWVALTNEGTGAGFSGGYALAQTLRDEAFAEGAFHFSRPEDVATNPDDDREVVLASTGDGDLFNGADNWGMTYIFDLNGLQFDASGLDLANSTTTLSILYDGNDTSACSAQFPGGSDFGLRSPDNLDWGQDGYIYVQEDRATTPGSLFGGTSGEEASIWQLNPNENCDLTRVAQVDRGATLLPGQSDISPTDLGNWETSGILDVTAFFPTKPGEKLFILDVQAHSVRGGDINSNNLVQGGQLGFLSQQVPEPSSLLGLGLFGLSAFGLKRKRDQQ
ncbi:protein of unknown function DUF1555 [Rippkaea orientalis PCC 8801]|uniref:Ice-binding protein C-terminal domain-containing protein n=1 Tax=Rippkaea orientalis (strain PCC 8801 / RF-1) TaxID=41431 RepID=B7JYT8_RIPO1|nr:alkaline phosphatase PhoX [Rippkaea orientalis]ACK66015.1 protein of unknown function DUF1555 [Rippkaea orientalis PCC 8801]